MPTSKAQTSNTTLQSLPVKMTDGLKSKVMAPRNPKVVKRHEKTTRVSFFVVVYFSITLIFKLLAYHIKA